MSEIEKLQIDIEGQILQEKDAVRCINLYRKLVFTLSAHNPSLALKKAEEALNYSYEHNDDFEQKITLFVKAVCLIEINEYVEAFKILLDAQKYFFKIKRLDYYSKVLTNLGVIYYNLSCYNQAIFIWRDILINYDNQKDVYYRYILINNLITVYLKKFLPNETILAQLLEIKKSYDKKNFQYDQLYCDVIVNLVNYYRIINDFNQSIKLAEEFLTFAVLDNYHKMKYELYYSSALSYKMINNETKMAYALKKALVLSKKHNYNFLQYEIFNELYIYSKTKNNFKDALEYIEHFLYWQKNRSTALNSSYYIVNQFDFEYNDPIKATYLNKYIEKYSFELERNILIDDSQGSLINVNIDLIIYAESFNKLTKIYFSNSSSQLFKIPLKSLMDLIVNKFENNHLFFMTNVRKEIVNLYWLSKFDKYSKRITLNVFGYNYYFNLSRNQYIIIKDFLASKK
jgi:tetratricopeptide (TPR) repeat protein